MTKQIMRTRNEIINNEYILNIIHTYIHTNIQTRVDMVGTNHDKVLTQ